jgi:GNAT superfamily N-acetyltransferase
LTDSDLKNFCDIDYSDVMALVVEKERLGRLEIIGVGRYYRLPPDHTAEIAMVVQDDEQQKGIGTQLLRHLATLAWLRDIHHFTGEVLRQNGRMLSIFRKADPQMRQEVDSPSTCTIRVSVAEAMNGTKDCLIINSH